LPNETTWTFDGGSNPRPPHNEFNTVSLIQYCSCYTMLYNVTLTVSIVLSDASISSKSEL